MKLAITGAFSFVSTTMQDASIWIRLYRMLSSLSKFKVTKLVVCFKLFSNVPLHGVNGHMLYRYKDGA